MVARSPSAGYPVGGLFFAIRGGHFLPDRETNTKLKGPKQLLEKRVFVSRQNDVYLMHELVALIDEYGEWQLACYEAVPK